jgi:DNA-directed RNA polymerase sigma subunit (sigma70/sigma32)
MTIDEDNEYMVSTLNLIPSDDDIIKDIAEDDKLNRFLMSLSKQEYEICVREFELFGHRKESQEVIAKDLGLSTPQYSARRQRLISKIKRYYTTGEIIQDAEKRCAEIYLKHTDNGVVQNIVERVYGINGKSKTSKNKVAEEFGVSVARVNKICERAVCGVLQDGDEISEQDVQNFISSSANSRERFICECLYGLNGQKQMKQHEIAKMLGLPLQNVHNMAYRIRNKIRLQKVKIMFGGDKPISIDEICDYYMNCANIREQTIIEHFWGINGEPTKTLVEISKILGLPYNTCVKCKESIELNILNLRIKESDNEM